MLCMFITAFFFYRSFTQILHFMVMFDTYFCEEFREDNLNQLWQR